MTNVHTLKVTFKSRAVEKNLFKKWKKTTHIKNNVMWTGNEKQKHYSGKEMREEVMLIQSIHNLNVL